MLFRYDIRHSLLLFIVTLQFFMNVSIFTFFHISHRS